MGYASTLDYVAAAAGVVLRETGLLPHVNAGVMGRRELRALKAVSASQGLMLESTSPALLLPGGAHHDCPDKVASSLAARAGCCCFGRARQGGRRAASSLHRPSCCLPHNNTRCRNRRRGWPRWRRRGRRACPSQPACSSVGGADSLRACLLRREPCCAGPPLSSKAPSAAALAALSTLPPPPPCRPYRHRRDAARPGGGAAADPRPAPAVRAHPGERGREGWQARHCCALLWLALSRKAARANPLTALPLSASPAGAHCAKLCAQERDRHGDRPLPAPL